MRYELQRFSVVCDVDDCRGALTCIGVKESLAVKTAATQTKPACAGFKISDFPFVRAGGHRLYSHDFQSLGLKLTPMTDVRPKDVPHPIEKADVSKGGFIELIGGKQISG